MKKLNISLLVLIVFPLLVFTQTLDEKLKAIDEYAKTVMSTWKSQGAGMAIAVVKDDKVVFQKGYGFRWVEGDSTRTVLPNSSVEEAYSALYNAVKSRNMGAIKGVMSKSTLEFGGMVSQRNNTPIDRVYENGFTATTFSKTLPQIRDVRLNGKFAAIEVFNSRENKWEDLPFVYEQDGWRLAIGEMFGGTYVSPGRSASNLANERSELSRQAGEKLQSGKKEPKPRSSAKGTKTTGKAAVGGFEKQNQVVLDKIDEPALVQSRPPLVDENTVFAIASNSKAFTAAALAILVDEKKIAWNDKVSKYLPDFEMYDPWVTKELTIRDLVSHRTGLDTFSGDLLWYETTYPTDEILRRLRYLKPAASFRSRYGYQNLMFIAAGRVLEKVSGKSWGEFVKERILDPLGMSRTTTSIKDLPDNAAWPHNESGGKLRILKRGNVDGAAPAAGLNSSVADLSKWIRLQLGRGTFEGKKIFSAEQSWAMWQPNIMIPISEGASKNSPTRHFNAYGMGWFMNDYYGRKVLNHSGGLDGMLSYTVLIPEENTGFVILTNSESPAFAIMMNKMLDVIVGAPDHDYNVDALERDKRVKAADTAERAKSDAARLSGTKPSLAPGAYAGIYSSQMYGDVIVTDVEGRLELRLGPAPNFVAELEHWQNDTFQIHWRSSVNYNFPRGFVTFTIDKNGKTDVMKIDQPNNDFWFYELDLKRSK